MLGWKCNSEVCSLVEIFAEVCISRTWLLYILEYCRRCWMQKSNKLQRSQIWQNFWPAHLPTFWISHRCALLRCSLMSLCGWCCLETDPIIECQTHSKPCLNLNHSSLVAVLNVDDDDHYLCALTKFGRIGIPSWRVWWLINNVEFQGRKDGKVQKPNWTSIHWAK